jgi:hypothetical protein
MDRNRHFRPMGGFELHFRVTRGISITAHELSLGNRPA